MWLIYGKQFLYVLQFTYILISMIYEWFCSQLKINTDSQSNDYEIYEGSTREEVISEYEEKHSKWSFNMFSSKPKAVKIDPFLPSCVGIETATPYNVELHMIRKN